MDMIPCMLIPSGSYKYCSWESKWLLTWLTRAFPSSSFLAERIPKILEFPWHILIHITIGSVSKSRRKTSKQKCNGGKTTTHAPTRATSALWRITTHGSTRAYLLAQRLLSRGPESRVRPIASRLFSRCGLGCPLRTRVGLNPALCRVSANVWSTPHQPEHDTCLTSILPRSSLCRPTRGDILSLSCICLNFQIVMRIRILDLFSSDFFMFKSVIRINKFSSWTL